MPRIKRTKRKASQGPAFRFTDHVQVFPVATSGKQSAAHRRAKNFFKAHGVRLTSSDWMIVAEQPDRLATQPRATEVVFGVLARPDHSTIRLHGFVDPQIRDADEAAMFVGDVVNEMCRRRARAIVLSLQPESADQSAVAQRRRTKLVGGLLLAGFGAARTGSRDEFVRRCGGGFHSRARGRFVAGLDASLADGFDQDCARADVECVTKEELAMLRKAGWQKPRKTKIKIVSQSVRAGGVPSLRGGWAFLDGGRPVKAPPPVNQSDGGGASNWEDDANYYHAIGQDLEDDPEDETDESYTEDD
jgi:hypothetical protein